MIMMEAKLNLFISVVMCSTLYSVNALLDKGVCPSGWRSLNGDCFFLSTAYKKWTNAKDICVDMGASLAQPTIAAEVRALAELIKGIKHTSFWVGARNHGEKTYKWLNGSQVTSGWRTSESSTTKPGHCVSIIYKKDKYNNEDNGLESDGNCSVSHRRFICQKKETHIGATVATDLPFATATTQDLDCPSRWLSLSGDCFYISTVPKKWQYAKSFCESNHQSSLAQPTNASQVLALASLLKKFKRTDNMVINCCIWLAKKPLAVIHKAAKLSSRSPKSHSRQYCF
ncbi:unnamed protein product, partial [Meganyctiphanes norvegica]